MTDACDALSEIEQETVSRLIIGDGARLSWVWLVKDRAGVPWGERIQLN